MMDPFGPPVGQPLIDDGANSIGQPLIDDGNRNRHPECPVGAEGIQKNDKIFP